MVKRKGTSQILVFILIASLLSAAFPLYHPRDVNRDAKVELADVIMSVRELASAADHPGTFKESVEKAITIMKTVAGLQTVIKPVRQEAGQAGGTTLLQTPYLISYYPIDPLPVIYRQAGEDRVKYTSIIISPEPPPPRA